ADAPSIRSQGTDLRVWGQNVRTGHELLQVVGLTSAESAYLQQRYGSNIDVVDLPSSQAPVPLDRENDTAPWNGGDFITHNSTGDCSSGIPVHNSANQYYLIIAAHCFPLHTNMYNGSVTIPYGNDGAMGDIGEQDTRQNGSDAELIWDNPDG